MQLTQSIAVLGAAVAAWALAFPEQLTAPAAWAVGGGLVFLWFARGAHRP